MLKGFAVAGSNPFTGAYLGPVNTKRKQRRKRNCPLIFRYFDMPLFLWFFDLLVFRCGFLFGVNERNKTDLGKMWYFRPTEGTQERIDELQLFCIPLGRIFENVGVDIKFPLRINLKLSQKNIH